MKVFVTESFNDAPNDRHLVWLEETYKRVPRELKLVGEIKLNDPIWGEAAMRLLGALRMVDSIAGSSWEGPPDDENRSASNLLSHLLSEAVDFGRRL